MTHPLSVLGGGGLAGADTVVAVGFVLLAAAVIANARSHHALDREVLRLKRRLRSLEESLAELGRRPRELRPQEVKERKKRLADVLRSLLGQLRAIGGRGEMGEREMGESGKNEETP